LAVPALMPTVLPKTRPARLSTLRRNRKAIEVAVAAGLAIGLVAFMFTRTISLTDGDAYWNAALRLRDGLPLYPAIQNEDLPTTYRYAPWLAWLWVPITFLPHGVAQLAWQAFMFVCAAIACIPALRRGDWLLAAFCGSMLAWSAQLGNVHAALVAMLVYALGTRWGPVAIGVAASLKIFPIGYAVVYVARREWGKALTAVAVALVLWAPALAYGIGAYPSDVGSPPNLWSIHPALWAAASVAALVLVLRSRAWWSASVFVVLGTLRFIAYDFGYLLVGQDRPAVRLELLSRPHAWRERIRLPVLRPVPMAEPATARVQVAESIRATSPANPDTRH
jgi:Glycosyltransferase family 87